MLVRAWYSVRARLGAGAGSGGGLRVACLGVFSAAWRRTSTTRGTRWRTDTWCALAPVLAPLPPCVLAPLPLCLPSVQRLFLAFLLGLGASNSGVPRVAAALRLAVWGWRCGISLLSGAVQRPSAATGGCSSVLHLLPVALVISTCLIWSMPRCSVLQDAYMDNDAVDDELMVSAWRGHMGE